jgi:signal peptidase I
VNPALLERPSATADAMPTRAQRWRAAVPLVAFGLLMVLLRMAVVEPFAISGGSMAPTLRPGAHVLVSKLAYPSGVPHHGDVIAYTTTGGAIVVKRVAGLPGDRIELSSGRLVRNGRPVAEPYVDPRRAEGTFHGPVTVPPGHIFVLGDNRIDSDDSRFRGPVPIEQVMGRAALRLWPPALLTAGGPAREAAR